jgi:hypothetical protein
MVEPGLAFQKFGTDGGRLRPVCPGSQENIRIEAAAQAFI